MLTGLTYNKKTCSIQINLQYTINKIYNIYYIILYNVQKQKKDLFIYQIKFCILYYVYKFANLV